MYNKYKSYSPFPQNIDFFKYPLDIDFYLEEIKKIRKTYPNQSKSPFYKDAMYSTDIHLFQQFPQFNPLQNYLENLIYHNYKFKPNIHNSWINIHPKHTFVSTHHHGAASETKLSGCFYLQLPPNDQGIYIYDKTNVGKRINLQLSLKDIVIFDGDQPHSTFPNIDDQEKIAIVFNIRELE